MNKANDGDIVNGCLVLKKKQYGDKEYENFDDFSVVYAPNLKIVASSMFENCSELEYVYIPNAVEIDGWGFCSCEILKTIFAPKLSKLGNSAFEDCPALDLLKYFPISKEQLEKAKDGELVNFHLVLKKESYPEAKFKERHDILFVHAMNLKAVSAEMFLDCSNLKSVFCPLVKVIKGKGFKECGSLTQITANQAKIVEEKAFESCRNLLTLHLPSV